MEISSNLVAFSKNTNFTKTFNILPKKAKFKPKVMDGDGSLSDHPNPDSLALRSKWQPIVIESFITYLNFDISSNHSKSEVFRLWIVHFHRK